MEGLYDVVLRALYMISAGIATGFFGRRAVFFREAICDFGQRAVLFGAKGSDFGRRGVVQGGGLYLFFG